MNVRNAWKEKKSQNVNLFDLKKIDYITKAKNAEKGLPCQKTD